MGVLCLSCV